MRLITNIRLQQIYLGNKVITEKLNIEGMACGHCVMAVRKELSRLPLKIKDVSIGFAEVEYDENKVNRGDILKAVERAGYKIIPNIPMGK